MRNIERPEVDPSEESVAPVSAGFMKFYGLYWKKDSIYADEKLLPGLPRGWTGQGKFKADFDRDSMWVNFWDQKGVYVLYDDQLVPVYTGQAGLIRKSKGKAEGADGGRCLGGRLKDHKDGKYRNGWRFFSWFGFLHVTN